MWKNNSKLPADAGLCHDTLYTLRKTIDNVHHVGWYYNAFIPSGADAFFV